MNKKQMAGNLSRRRMIWILCILLLSLGGLGTPVNAEDETSYGADTGESPVSEEYQLSEMKGSAVTSDTQAFDEKWGYYLDDDHLVYKAVVEEEAWMDETALTDYAVDQIAVTDNTLYTLSENEIKSIALDTMYTDDILSSTKRIDRFAVCNGSVFYMEDGVIHRKNGDSDEIVLEGIRDFWFDDNETLCYMKDEEFIYYRNIVNGNESRMANMMTDLESEETASEENAVLMAASVSNLSKLKEKFPHGKYWNHVGKSGNNQNGYTSKPCSSHKSTATCNAFQIGSTKYSWQCMGYAEKCGYDMTGYNPRINSNGWKTYTSSSALDKLKAGDIVRYSQHSIYVTAVSGNTVTYTDCNGAGSKNYCMIQWGRTIAKSTLRSSFKHLRSAPQSPPNGTPPNPPKNLKPEPLSTTSVKLSWSASSGATSYRIEGREMGGSWKTIATTSSTSYTLKGLKTGWRYWYSVHAKNGSGESGDSNVIWAYPKAAAPTVTAVSGSTSLKLSWSEVDASKSYDVYRKAAGESSFTVIKKGLTSKTYTDTGLKANTKYSYYIRHKVNWGGETGTVTVDSEIGTGTTLSESYTNTISLWASGFKNQEGNNQAQNMFSLGASTFTKTKGESFAPTTGLNQVIIPNGFALNNTSWGSRGFTSDGTWKWYSFGDKVTQPAKKVGIQYNCDPVSYKITYNLNGGTNAKENPSTYNVLYGVSLKDPARFGYSFTGWTDSNGNKVTGINVGANATFSSASDLYSKLKSRTTGNQTLTANWEAMSLKPAENAEQPYEGYYTIAKADTGSYIERASDGNVQLSNATYNTKKVWNLKKQLDGTYVIEDNATETLLDADRCGISPKTNVGTWKDTDTLNQKWFLIPTGETDSYYIRSAYCDLYLDVNGNTSNPGTNIQLYTKNQSTAQKFVLRRPVYNVNFYNNYSGKNYILFSDLSEELNTQAVVSRDLSTSTLSLDKEVTHNGFNTMKVINQSPGEVGKDMAWKTSLQDTVANGSVGNQGDMILSFWAKASEEGTTASFRWGFEPTGDSKSVTLGTEWKYYTIPMKQSTAYNYHLHPWIDRAGTVWFSEIQLEDGAVATDFQPENGDLYATVEETYVSKYSLPQAPVRGGYDFAGWYTSASGGEPITETTDVAAGHRNVYAHWTAKTIVVESVEINKKELQLDAGMTETLTATVKPENATDPTVIWTSSDEAVATVSADGTVTAVAGGTATITATAGGQSTGCVVTVVNNPSVLIGDVNQDGKVDRVDAAILNRYLAKWDGYEQKMTSMDAADVNKDGKVDRVDAAILSRYLAKWDGYESYFE